MESPHILYVSSDRDSSELMPRLLGDRPWRIESVHTASGALQLAAERPFEVYVLGNWWLDDGVRGIELCLDLRQQDPTTPVLFYSSSASPSDIDAALATGAVAYIVKPDLTGLLERKINAILESSAVRSQEARLEELRVTGEQIKSHLRETDYGIVTADSAVQTASTQLTRAFSLLLQAEAKMAFYRAGGTRSHFERMWPGVLEEARQRAY